jgi:hypothetical protein
MNPDKLPRKETLKIIGGIKGIAEENRKGNGHDVEMFMEIMSGASVASLQEVFPLMSADARDRLFMAVEMFKSKTAE